MPPAILDPGQLLRVANFLGLSGPKQQASASGTAAQPIRIGVLGASQVCTYAALWPSRRLQGCEVVAVAARDGGRAAAFAKQHCIPRSYGSYDDLLADPGIDAVYVGLPNGLHGAWAKRALQAGKHVLCEKPFAANEEEAREVQEVARKKGLLCREAFHYREHPLLPRLQQLVSPPLQHGGSEGGHVKTNRGSGGAAVLASAAGTAGTGPSAGSAEGATTPGGGGASSLSSSSSNTSGRNFSGSANGSSFRGGDGGGGCSGGDGGVLGEVQRIDVRLLIPKWVFGSGDIRWMEGLAGGAMMDAGCYCSHVSRSLAAAALGEPRSASGGGAVQLHVLSAAAKLRHGSESVDGAMVVNWSTADPLGGSTTKRKGKSWFSRGHTSANRNQGKVGEVTYVHHHSDIDWCDDGTASASNSNPSASSTSGTSSSGSGPGGGGWGGDGGGGAVTTAGDRGSNSGVVSFSNTVVRRRPAASSSSGTSSSSSSSSSSASGGGGSISASSGSTGSGVGVSSSQQWPWTWLGMSQPPWALPEPAPFTTGRPLASQPTTAAATGLGRRTKGSSSSSSGGGSGGGRAEGTGSGGAGGGGDGWGGEVGRVPLAVPGAISGRLYASLQADNLLPISEIRVTGTRGTLLCKNFAVPFFGHIIHTSVERPPPAAQGEGALQLPWAPLSHFLGSLQGRGGRMESVERVYGSGETTYYYQLERFVGDVRALSSGSGAASTRKAMAEDAEDCIANMRFVDDAYIAAGLEPRQPSGVAVQHKAAAIKR